MPEQQPEHPPSPEWIVLHGRGVTAILECPANEAPLWRYWGPRLPDGVTPPAPLRAGRLLPTFSPDFDQPLPLCPGLGGGWFGAPALMAHRAGEDWTFAPTHCAVERAPHGAVIALDDPVAQIHVTIRLSIDPDSGVLMLSTMLDNAGDDVLDVQWLAAGTIPLPPHATTVRSYSGRHNGEFVPVQDKLSRSTWRRENRRGLTSHDCFPGAVVEAQDCVFGAQLAWSGNHAQMIDWIDDGRYQWQMGEGLAPGEVRLAPGERLETPEMLATCAADANCVAQNFHVAVRKRISWPGGTMKPRPVHINTWEGFYFNHDEAALIALADAAAALGIERFVLDDGWFHGRDNDRSSLGDWWVDARKYPNGLRPLADHVTGLGMEFGLWVEPEMVNPDSDLHRAHPDWALAIAGRQAITARNQMVLDMSRAEVRDHLFGRIAALLETLPISYLKWDHNRDLTVAGNRPAFRAQVTGAYDLMAQIRAAFPHVEIEACAGGGGRIDAGIVRHTHRFWTSDNIDAVSRLSIQRGFLQFMPPEIMGAHVGASPAHATGRQQSMAFRAGVAMPGHFGVELDVRTLSTGERDALSQAIKTHKDIRDRIHGARTWVGDGDDGLIWQAYQKGEDYVVFVYRIQPQSWRHPPPLRLPMLDKARRYQVDDVALDGTWIAAQGIALPPLAAETMMMVMIKAVA